MARRTQLEQEALQRINDTCDLIIAMINYEASTDQIMDEFSALRQHFKKLEIAQSIKEGSYGTAFHRNIL